MSKKSRYKVGDIFTLPIGKDLFGIGRILIVQSPSLFVGFYKRIMREGEAISIDSLIHEEYLLKILCGDLGFIKNEWKIIGNLALSERVPLPLFWGREVITNSLYLRKYNPPEDRPLDMIGFRDRLTTEDEIEKEGAQPDGLSGWKAAEIKLKYYLEKAGIL